MGHIHDFPAGVIETDGFRTLSVTQEITPSFIELVDDAPGLLKREKTGDGGLLGIDRNGE